MTKKIEKIAEILEEEKKKRLEMEKIEKEKVLKKQAKLKLEAEKAEKWTMLKWINEYIAENQERWDNMELVTIQEKFELEDWKKQNLRKVNLKKTR